MPLTWFEIAVIVPLVVCVHYLQQMKIALKVKGYPIQMFTGWRQDFRWFQELIEKETNEEAKIGYMRIYNGIRLSAVFLVVVLVMRAMGKI